mmetsp:Transcript_9251/g.13934  ORF Transcript_9251/g.13934 Transcript_9251/m.13934 type:complete len:328 (-) Transcript_9251:186-1169(-)|eukprot:CAMPEP_0185019990 /NCGR_PEP_ID=MMETSP1103-20130426/2584_1 /TAXON_ID=36769 /ORGANISM="Paraphysomonas bandaiensis, Strain Caron Lab Isolate" /LENGTH=327 /DNA_ID=CAMNT_0027550609 /DNA_START=64 /DNA_END=1047 /DNA_ORIENTATION=-
MSLQLNHLVSVSQISRELVRELITNAESMRALVLSQGGDDSMKHRVMANVFFEASTRTSCSFQAAMQRLGGSVVCVSEMGSSSRKGEVLEDTIATMACYCDLIVLRHPMKGSAEIATTYSSKPVINAGDGTGEHPTQALLDIYTIHLELGRVGQWRVRSGEIDRSVPVMTVTIVGDLKHGRTVHSLVRLLAMYPGLKLVYISPSTLRMPDDVIEEVQHIAKGHGGIEQTSLSADSLLDGVAEADVLYVTRIQRERFESEHDYQKVMGSYCINAAAMSRAKENMVIMHPLPRVNEIAKEVDSDPRAAYFRQMENGMHMRMSLIKHLLL